MSYRHSRTRGGIPTNHGREDVKTEGNRLMAHNGGPATPGLLHQQLDTPSRVDEITDRLITAIAIGEYLPGARLRSNVTSPRHWGQGA